MHWNRLPTGDRIRVAGYVCYQPRSHATPEQIERKKEIFEQRRVATHVSVLHVALSGVYWLFGEKAKGERSGQRAARALVCAVSSEAVPARSPYRGPCK